MDIKEEKLKELEYHIKEVFFAAKYWGNKETSDNGTSQKIGEAKENLT